jgi:hypothetical protein
VTQLPLEQSSEQSPVAGQVSAQLPLEQEVAHGEAAHWAVQLPLGHEHMVELQLAMDRVPPSSVSGTAGPPFGPVPPGEEPREEPHARRPRRRALIEATPTRPRPRFTIARQSATLDAASTV